MAQLPASDVPAESRVSLVENPAIPETISHQATPLEFHEASTLPRASTAPGHLPSQVGPYHVVQEIARGGMGVVYKACDPKLGRIVALKMMRGDLGAGKRALDRFRREAEVASRLDHPHIVPIFHVEEHEGQPFFTMGYMEGGNLAQIREFQPRGVVSIVIKIARAVHFAHAKGVLHRDLKPSNIFLDEKGEPRVGDFGLAKLGDADVELTHSGDFLGTPAYMAPEQASGRISQINARTDVWALGVILYELLAGRRPFTGQTRDQVVHEILTCEPQDLRNKVRGIDRSLETIVLKCLEKDQHRRYASAEALADDLQRWLDGQPIHARPEGIWRRSWRRLRRYPAVAAAVAMAVIFAIVLAIVTTEADPDQPVHEYHRELAAGRPVTLIGEKGPPRRFRWIFGQGGILASPVGDGAFFVQSFEPVILELLPEPLPEKFWLKARVRHSAHDSGGFVGIVFMHARNETTLGVEHCFAELVISEFSGQVQLNLHRLREKGIADFHDHQATTGVRSAFQVDRQTAGSQWRSLDVKVTSDAIEPFWEGKPLRRYSRQELEERARTVLSGNNELTPNRQFLAEGGIGLFVARGGAGFQDVVVEPIP